ncbi:MAG: class I SAM-dependent methyltransferase [Candidatus Omnitrophota bacterium]
MNKNIKEILLRNSYAYSLLQSLSGSFRACRKFVDEYLKIKDNDKVVDVGCGPGVLLNYIDKNIDYHGIDISEKYIRTARQRFRGRGEFHLGSFTDVQDDERLQGADLVVCRGVFHHLSDAEVLTLLKFAKGILKEDGRLVSYDPCYIDDQHWLARLIASNDRGEHVRFVPDLEDLVKEVYEKYDVHVVKDLLRQPSVHNIMECYKT